MIEAILTILGLMGGLTDIGGFALDHPHFWQHRASDDVMAVRCANAFKTYDWEKKAFINASGHWQHCPKE